MELLSVFVIAVASPDRTYNIISSATTGTLNDRLQ